MNVSCIKAATAVPSFVAVVEYIDAKKSYEWKFNGYKTMTLLFAKSVSFMNFDGRPLTACSCHGFHTTSPISDSALSYRVDLAQWARVIIIVDFAKIRHLIKLLAVV